MKCQTLFSGKNIINLPSTENAHRVVKVNLQSCLADDSHEMSALKYNNTSFRMSSATNLLSTLRVKTCMGNMPVQTRPLSCAVSIVCLISHSRCSMYRETKCPLMERMNGHCDDWKHCRFKRSLVAENFCSTEHDFFNLDPCDVQTITKVDRGNKLLKATRSDVWAMSRSSCA